MTSAEHFDLANLHECFQKTGKDGDIMIEALLESYHQIYLLFGSLGKMFSFMSSDVLEKMKILRGLLESENGQHYKNIQAMLPFEAEKGLAPTKTKKIESGVRAYSRLHRGLAFVAELFIKLADTPESEYFGPIAKKCYEDSLAKYHPWLIKKGVGLALMSLQSNCLDLAISISIVDKASTSVGPEQRELMRKVGNEAKILHDIGEKLLGDAQCLDLP